MSTATLTAYRPTDSLMTSLARAGWGDLSGRSMQGIRSTLRGLVDLLPHKSGMGLATAPQIADAAGLSERWVRRCLGILEDAGVITWTRGGVVDGKPCPSYFRISKTLLVALVHGARPVLAAVEAARARQTAARLGGLRKLFVKSKDPRHRTSAHAALSASPPPKGKDHGTSVPVMPLYLNDEQAQTSTSGADAIRAMLAARGFPTSTKQKRPGR